MNAKLKLAFAAFAISHNTKLYPHSHPYFVNKLGKVDFKHIFVNSIFHYINYRDILVGFINTNLNFLVIFELKETLVCYLRKFFNLMSYLSS